MRAPITGVAGIAKGQVGDLIESNTLLTTVSQLDLVKVQFPLYLRIAARIATAMRAGARQAAAVVRTGLHPFHAKTVISGSIVHE